MRAISLLLTAGALISFQNSATFEGDGAEKLFRQSRSAIGGEGAVTSITSLVMKGIVRVSAGDDGPPERTIELRVLLPDRYVRIEAARDWTKRSGFSGKNLLTEITKGGQTERPPVHLTAGLLRGERGRFARMLLGIASMTSPEVWLTLRQPSGPTVPRLAHATSAAGSRELEATARDNFIARILYDTAGAPQRVQYETSGRRIAIMFADRRKVGGLLLPHTITTTLNGMPLEEIRLSEIVVNAPLTTADFEK